MKKIDIWNNRFAFLDLMIWRHASFQEYPEIGLDDSGYLGEQMFAIWHGLTNQ